MKLCLIQLRFLALGFLIGRCRGFSVTWCGHSTRKIPLRAATDMECSTRTSSTVDEEFTSSKPYGEEFWGPYEDFVQNNMLNSSRVLKKDKIEDLQSVVEYILTDHPIVQIPTFAGSIRSKEDVMERMAEQTEAFNRTVKFSNVESEFAIRCFTYLADNLAKQRNPKPVAIAWQKVKESGLVLRENALSTFMYVLGLDPSLNDLLLEVATFHDWIYPPNEKTITLRIKALIQMEDPHGAEDMLATLPDDENTGGWKRLRTFSPILEYYCSIGDGDSILRIFREMRDSPGVYFDSATYALIIGSLAKLGLFKDHATGVEAALGYRFSATSGKKLFDEIMAEMAEDLLDITEASALELVNAFNPKAKSSQVPKLASPSDMNEDVLVGQVDIDNESALCPVSGAKLRLFALEESQRRHVHDTLLEFARTQQAEFAEKLKRQRKKKGQSVELKDIDETGEQGFEDLSRFSDWLGTRDGEPFTAIVDGPNVAYFGHANLHYKQIALVVKQLIAMGENPLVTMPHKYARKSFRLSHGGYQTLTDDELDILEWLKAEDMIYVVPIRSLDDYYWMLASVANQTASYRYGDMYVSTDDESERFPGLRPMLVTNDQMRDHKLELLEPREFRRWKSCHIVNYNVSSITEAADGDDAEMQLTFYPADFFSREIQGNLDQEQKGLAWHIPVMEWGDTERLLIKFS